MNTKRKISGIFIRFLRFLPLFAVFLLVIKIKKWSTEIPIKIEFEKCFLTTVKFVLQDETK